MSKLLIICEFLCSIIMVKCEDILDTFTLSSASLDTANSQQFGAYYADEDTLWILGGYKCQTCIYSYDPSEDSISQHTDITGGYNPTQDNSVIIDDVIYFITHDGDIVSYDVSTGKETNPLYSTDLDYPCLVKNEDNSQLYVVNGNNDFDFWIYDIEYETFHSGPDLNNDRFKPSCTVDSNNFFYVSFGKEDKIERINLTYFSSNSYTEYGDIEWEVLTSDTTDPTFEDEMDCSGDAIYSSSSFEVFGDIYIISGLCSSSSGMIIKLDTDSFELSYIGRTPVEISSAEFMVRTIREESNERMVYIFGGYTTTYLDTIYYSNVISRSSLSSESSVFLVSPKTSYRDKLSFKSNALMNMRLSKIIDNENETNVVLNNIRFILFAIGVLLILVGGLFGIFIYKKMDSSIKEKEFSYQNIA